jgi:peptidoglycan/xylan/chitin deacetylase (PgdA/CDA1 family)
MKLTLSFDNGPDPEGTPEILRILRTREVRAHFFVLGKHVATPAGRALVEREIGEGHLVGNHSYTHETPLGDDLRVDAVAQEIVATQALLDPLLGDDRPRRFRPFGGGGLVGPHLLSRAALAHLQAERYTCVLWNAVPRDWLDPRGWSTAALAALAENDHTVLVLHDVADACGDALDGFLGAAKDQGAEIGLELPRACTPILGGHITSDIAPLVRGGVS